MVAQKGGECRRRPAVVHVRAFILQIVYRYVLNDPLGWTEEVIIVTWLWTVLWGAAFVVDEVEEIRFDIIYSNMPERTRRIFTVMTGVTLDCPLRDFASRRVSLRELS